MIGAARRLIHTKGFHRMGLGLVDEPLKGIGRLCVFCRRELHRCLKLLLGKRRRRNEVHLKV